MWRRFGIDYQRCLSLDPKGPRVDPCEQVSIWIHQNTVVDIVDVVSEQLFPSLRSYLSINGWDFWEVFEESNNVDGLVEGT